MAPDDYPLSVFDLKLQITEMAKEQEQIIKDIHALREHTSTLATKQDVEALATQIGRLQKIFTWIGMTAGGAIILQIVRFLLGGGFSL